MGISFSFKKIAAPDTGLGTVATGVPFVLGFLAFGAACFWASGQVEQKEQKPAEAIQTDQPTDAASLPAGTTLTLNGGP